MLCGIVDLGSNTIRLSIYHCDQGQFRLLMHKKTMAGLAGYVQEGVLSDSGILVACLLNLNQAKILLPAINEGANGSMGAIMNTACAVGFGSVVKVVPGFAVLTNIALNMPGSMLFSEAVAVNLLAGATGSASGGMSIALEALGPRFAEMAAGNPSALEALHRIASISSGGLDTLPHNGAVLTLLAVSNCTHKESYLDICVTTCIIPLVASLLLALVWGFIGI